MADLRSQVLDLIYWTARRKGRHKYLIGPTKRVNQERVAEAIGVDPSTLSRIVGGQQPTTQFLQALVKWTEADDLAALFDQLSNAQPAKPGAYGPNYP